MATEHRSNSDDGAAALNAELNFREHEELEIVDDDEERRDEDDVKMDDGNDEELMAPEEMAQEDMVILDDDSVQGFFEHSEPIYAIATHPTNPKHVVCGAGDDLAFVWDLGDGETVHKLSGHTDSVISVSYNHDGSLLATASLDKTIRVSRRK